jgi:Spy/CpxP family protein refolding chaperone
MNRRQVIMLSGAAAAAAGHAIAKTHQTTGLSATAVSPRASYKALLRLSRPKSSHKVPKNDARKAKYIRSLSAALTLTPGQEQQADAIYSNALAARATLHASLKTARHNLHNAVKRMDSALIDQLSSMVGNIRAQRVAAGANANAAFYRILTPDQQSKLIRFQS